MALNNPINQREVIDTFREYVEVAANSGIVWTGTSKPFEEMPAEVFGASEIRTTDLTATGAVITARVIYDRLILETNQYIRLKNMQAIKRLLGDGGASSVVFDETRKAQFSAAYLTSRARLDEINNVNSFGVNFAKSEKIFADADGIKGLLPFFAHLRTRYQARMNEVVTVEITVCHSSCHSSCHNSRLRR